MRPATSRSASSRTFTFDSSEPETTIDSSMPDPTNQTSASFDFSADEPGATFECAIDGGAWGACTSPKAYAGLADGGHTFEVRATDPAGNTDGNPAAFNWTIDTVAPTSTAVFPANAGSYTAAEWDAGCTAAGLCGTYSDTGVGVVDVEVSIRRGTANYWGRQRLHQRRRGVERRDVRRRRLVARLRRWRASPPTATTPCASARGTTPATSRHRRAAPSPTTRPRPPRPRASRPQAARTTPPAGPPAARRPASAAPTPTPPPASPKSGASPSVRGSGDYWDGSGFTSASEIWNDATFAAGDWAYDRRPSADLPADGSYTVRVRATDVAGNVEAASSRTFTYDTTAPQTTIDANPANPTASDDADFDFSANEAGATFECRLDGGAWGPCSSPHSYATLADGSHVFDVRATDVAGNVDGSRRSPPRRAG